MTEFSLDLKNALLSGGYSKFLEDTHQKFLAGDRSALMTILIACSLFQEIIPDWVADELLTLDAKIADNQIDDMNEFFSFKPKHKSTHGVSRQIKKHEKKIVDALFIHRTNGKNFTTDDGLSEVAEALGLGRRLVEEVYKRNKAFLKAVPKASEQTTMIGTVEMLPLLELAQFKRQQQD